MTSGDAPNPAPGEFDDQFDDLAAIAYRVAFRLLGSRSDAEDIAQEALARAAARWRRVAGHAEPWVARVASNLALDALRRAKRRPTGPLGDENLAGDPRPQALTSSGSTAAVDRLELVRLLEGLPRRQREVVVMRYLADLTEAATARELGTSVGSVKKHAHRGLTALRLAWADLEGDLESLPRTLTNPGAM